MTNDWYGNFFDGLAVDFWVTAVPSPGDDLGFLESVFGAPAGQRILDLACGAGRHAIPLADRGYRVTGVDISDEFLARGKALAEASGADVEWHRGDIADLPWSEEFDGALCFGNTFGFFDPQTMLRVLASAARSLKRGGALVVETGMVAESLLPGMQDRRWFQVGDILFLSEASYDALDSRLDVHYTFIRGDARESKTAHNWVYTTRELRALFEQCGLRTERTCSTPKGDAFRLASPRLLLVARKA